MKRSDREAAPPAAASALVEFEPVVVSAPPSIALEGIERYLRVRNNRIVILVQPKSCVATLSVLSHPNNAIVSRFDDRIELSWHAYDVSCPDVSGRLTIRPLGNSTELIFKGRCDAPHTTARGIVRGVLEQFKNALEVEFETLKAR